MFFSLPRKHILFVVFFASLLFSASADVFLLFDNADVGAPFMGGSSQTTGAAKFGEGSMATGDDELMGVGGAISAFDAPAELDGEITRMTISVWIMPGEKHSRDLPIFILQRLNGSKPGGFLFQYTTQGRFLFFTSRMDEEPGVAKVYSNPLPELPQGEWTHLAMTFEDGKVIFYFNGQEFEPSQPLPDGATSIPDITNSGIGVLRALVSSPGVRYADDFGFFSNEALSPAEIGKLHEKGLKAYLESR